MNRLLSRLMDCVFPPRCILCDELLAPGEHYLHDHCVAQIQMVEGTHCMRCGRPVLAEGEEFCRECHKTVGRRGYNPDQSFEENRILFIYQGPMKNTMYRFKYSNRREYAPFFGVMAAKMYGQWMKNHGVNCIVPVPMNRHKQRIRGYNQAALLARAISRQTGIPAEPDLVRRCLNTAPLKLMDENTRQKTLEKAFEADRLRISDMHYETVLVVDDIYTTGSTLSAVALQLKKAGVKKVYGLTICGPKQ